jgi:hypothetical protein
MVIGYLGVAVYLGQILGNKNKFKIKPEFAWLIWDTMGVIGPVAATWCTYDYYVINESLTPSVLMNT